MLFDTSNILLDIITNDSLKEKNIHLSVLRLDKIHPVISGNKLFKLHYFLQEAVQYSLPGMVTFGGPYSNHLVATAFACKTLGLQSVGFIRGEKPAVLSPTLLACEQYGMLLQFISRTDYALKESTDFLNEINTKWPGYTIIPEGGYGPKGAAGGALIIKYVPINTTHICTAIGTATTFAGLVAGAQTKQQVIGIPVLKGMHDIAERVAFLTDTTHPFELLDGYHFGGYAKKTPELLQFMNQLFDQYKIPTDFVYTAKMMFAIVDKIEKGYFAEGSNIVCLHTGGLQGNQSLPAGTLIF